MRSYENEDQEKSEVGDEVPHESSEAQEKPWSRSKCLEALKKLRKAMIYHGVLPASNLMDAEEEIYSFPLKQQKMDEYLS